MLSLLAAAALAADDPCGLLLRDLEAATARGPEGAPPACGSAALLPLTARAHADGLGACLDSALQERGLTLAPAHRNPGVPALSRGGAKDTRDASGGYPNMIETDNFAIKWGSNTSFSRNDVQAMGDAFEFAWAEEIGRMGYAQPYSTDRYRFNVYIANTGSGTPTGDSFAGYYYTDQEGYPMIVMHDDTVAYPDQSAGTAAHEFFHALQDAAGTYEYSGQGAWYWEAGAMWVEGEIYPAGAGYVSFIAGQALLPELPINYFLYPDGSLAGYHQYGAGIFLRHITEVVTGDPEIIRRSWLEAPFGGDPLVVLDDLLADHQTDIRSEFFAFSSRSATWDYEDRDAYETTLAWWEPYFESHRPTGTVDGIGEYTPDAALRPYTFGANLWKIEGGEVALSFSVEPLTEGADWRAWVATRDGNNHTRTEIPIGGGNVTAELTGDAWVVVAAADGTVDQGEQFDYRLTVGMAGAIGPDPTDTDVDTGLDTEDIEDALTACGCSAGPRAGLPAVLAALLMLGRRSRVFRR